MARFGSLQRFRAFHGFGFQPLGLPLRLERLLVGPGLQSSGCYANAYRDIALGKADTFAAMSGWYSATGSGGRIGLSSR